LGLADAEGEALGDADAVAVLEGEGDVDGLALALALAVADAAGDAAGDVVVVVVVGVQETAATEILAAIARLYNENFFMNKYYLILNGHTMLTVVDPILDKN